MPLCDLRKTWTFLWPLAFALMALAACGSSEQDAREQQRLDFKKLLGDSESGSQAVASVNGRPIDAEAFAHIVARSDGTRSKRELLDELLATELLYEEALERGYGDGDALVQYHKRSMVARLLEDKVERPNQPEAIPAREVESYYNAHLYLYYSPAMRTTDHLLVMPQKKGEAPAPEALHEQAYTFAAKIKADMDARGIVAEVNGDKLEEVADRHKPQLPEGLEIRVERAIRTPRRPYGEPGEPGYTPGVVVPFADALFVATPGVPTEPVRTVFGTHIIALQQLHPEVRVTKEQAETGIREFLSNERARVAARDLIEGIIRKSDIKIDPEAPTRLEAADKELEPAQDGGE